MRDGLDVVVRFHDPRRFRELDRCMFSLAGQSHRPLTIHLVTQRFTAAELAALRSALAPMAQIEDGPTIAYLNWEQSEPADARSILSNLGIQAGRGRYLAFLDYDDLLYPEAYELLIARLQASAAGIAFGQICTKKADVYESMFHIVSRETPFQGDGILDLFTANFCPVHSFVIDRTRVPSHLLQFDPMLSRDEDYDFLLRVCSQAVADFSLSDTVIGEYLLKSDGSNTILTESARSDIAVSAWEAAESFIEARRRTLLVSRAVQASLGIDPAVPGMTIHQLLQHFGCR